MKPVFFKHRIDARPAAGTCRQRRGHLVIGLLALTVATVGPIAFARAADELPNQDQALARALENHPDIVAAKAKLALAEAELYGKRMEVSRQVLGLYGNLRMLEAQVEAAQAALHLSKAEFERTNAAAAAGALDQATKNKMEAAVRTAEATLVQAVGQREQAEKELRLLIGAAPPAKERASPNEAARPARQTLQGPIVDIWKTAAEKSITLEFVDMPLEEMLRFFSDETRIKFSLQRPALEEIGLEPTTTISLSTNEVPLRAALQGFEDAYPDLQFVLRDYGVLLTTKEYAESVGYFPVSAISRKSDSDNQR
jgi:hypothetical protein